MTIQEKLNTKQAIMTVNSQVSNSVKYLLLGVFSFFYFFSFAQTPDEELYELQQLFPEDDAIYEFSKDKINFFLDNEELSATISSERQSVLISDKASYFSKGQIWYSSLFELQDVEVYSLIPGPKKYAMKKVAYFEEKDDLSGASFHDDNKLKLFEYPNLIKGAKRYIYYKHKVVEPALLGSYRFSEGYKSNYAELEITVDAGIEIGFELFNCDSLELDYSLQEGKNGTKIYTWSAKNLEEIESEAGAPDYKYYTPHVLYYVKSYEANNEVISLLDGVQGLHKFYNNFLDTINQKDSEELKSLVKEIVDPNDKELDQVKSIYQWVQNNIRYVAFEDGYGGFIPRQAKDIYQKRFGDCKDMASIIHEMLKYADIESHWTWIGSRSLPYKYSEIATPSVDNHMINTYISGDKYYFLDGTSSDTPFGIPTAFIQGKEALVHINEDSFVIASVPEIQSMYSTVDDSLHLIIEDGILKGDGRIYFSGYHRNKVINYLGDADGDKRKDKVKGYTQKGSNKYQLNSYKESNKDNKDLPYKVEFNFDLPDYVIGVEDKLYVNLNLEKYFESFKLEEDRKYPLELDFKQEFKNLIHLEIPEGYKVDFLPKADSFENDLFSFEVKYAQNDNEVILEQKVVTNFLFLQKESFEEFNDFIKTLKNAYSEAIVLSK